MNYTKIYNSLIDSRKTRIICDDIYYENHHIVMRSMGGSNESTNMVKLTAREHFLAHWLLWRIHRNRQTASAFFFMCSYNKTSSKMYKEAREACAFANKKFWEEKTKEERYEIIKNRKSKWTQESRSLCAQNASIAYWNSLTENEIHDKQSHASLSRWNKLNTEERAALQSAKSKKTWDISKEERSIRAKMIWQKRKENGTNKRKPGIVISTEGRASIKEAARLRKINKN